MRSSFPYASLLLAAAACQSPLPGDCFSPQHPEGAGDPERVGCVCEADASACMRADDESWVALECVGGRWEPGDSSACPPATAGNPACEVEGVVYAHGSGGITDPFSCNTCGCASGALVCTRIGCPRECPSGTVAGSACVECGPADGCLVVRTGCLTTCESDDDCGGLPAFCDTTTGTCVPGACL